MVPEIRAHLSGGHPLISLVLAGFAAAQAAAPAPSPRPQLSAAAAQSLARKLEAIERRAQAAEKAASKTVVVTESELNSYLNLATPPKLPPGVSEVEFRLEHERIEARGQVDLSRLPVKGAGASGSLLSLLSGLVVAVELKGRLPNDDGVATIELDEIRFGGISVSVAVLAPMVAQATRTPDKPQGFDIRSPFPLPYSMKRVRLERGRALLDFQ